MERRSRRWLAPTFWLTPTFWLAPAWVLALVAVLALAGAAGAHAQPHLAPGDPLPRIQCPPGYTARVYAQGLVAPDGLAISPAGILHVAEEQAGRVSRIDAGGHVTPVLTGLDSPEGITFSPQTGALYVVEDVEDGRLVERASNGTVTVLAGGLEAPEGVTWADGTLYLTESNLQFAPVVDLRTRIAALPPTAALTRVITDTPVLNGTRIEAWSYAGIVAGPDGRLYVTNELAGITITRTVVIPGFPPTTLTLTTTDSIFAVDPAAATRTLFASGLNAPEGLRFSPGGGFPLSVAEEDLGGGRGRISVVDADGRSTPLCTGFMVVEDVILDPDGTLYVSEDGSGMVIAIDHENTEPDPVPIDAVQIEGPVQALVDQASTFTALVQPLSATLPITYHWSATGQAQVHTLETGASGGLSDTITYSWSQPGSQTITVRATNRAGTGTATHAFTVLEKLQADFSGSPRSGIAPLTVALTNRSSGSYQARVWELGDGQVSTVENPVHTYALPGSYSVTLTIVGPAGSDSRTRAGYVTVWWGSYLPVVFRPM
jgi:glucose/arabinose dehydrogenase